MVIMEMSISQMRWVILIQDISVFLLCAFLVVLYIRWRYGTPYKSILQLNTTCKGRDFFYLFLLIFAVQPFINLCAAINSDMPVPFFLRNMETLMRQLDEHNKAVTSLLLSDISIMGIVANIIVIGGVAAFCEEVFFRGALQSLLTKFVSPHIAVWCSAFFFSLIHLQFSGFFPRLLLGVLFGYIVVWSKSLWSSIFMHFVNNAGIVLIYAYMTHKGLSIDTMNHIGTHQTLWMGIVSLLVSAVGIYFIKVSFNVNSTSSRNDAGNSILRS